ncbi:hypothetical protein GCM10023220_00890 [Streptomyces ziwulingensis]|uniref:Gram-positive cocci surface proteins LPxTG domain-containing protein n=1 Tax=Streptomyces ziwulingensis TaxID=1045501 RepID=A0ABP9AKR1_9ACTN
MITNRLRNRSTNAVLEINEATQWLIGGAAVLIAGGGVALAMARRNRTDSPADDSAES